MLRRSLLGYLGAAGPAASWNWTGSQMGRTSLADAATGGSALLVLPSIAALRAHPTSPLQAGAIALIAGATAPLDGKGGVYVWDATSLASDDFHSVLAPDAGVGGRWIRFIDASRLLLGDWAALPTNPGLREGTLVDVVGDPGVHLDPEIGRSVANSGTYRLLGGRWSRVGDLSAPYAHTAFAADGSRTLRDYLPADRREAALAGSDRTTDHTPYLQAMLDDGIETIDLGGGTYNLRTPLRPRKSVRLRGRAAATVLRSGVNGYILETDATGQRFGLQDLSIEADPALGRAAGFHLFDPATYNISGVQFRGFARSALRLVQGVSVAVIDSTFVNCGMAAGEAAVWFDPGKTATVLPVVERCYIAGCATGLKAVLARGLRLDATIFETCGVATDFSRVDGLMTNCWFEANRLDGRWEDSSGLQRIKVISTNPDGGLWQVVWSGSGAADRGLEVSEGAFAQMRAVVAQRFGAARSWSDIRFDRAGPQYRASPMAGGQPAVMQVLARGSYAVDYRAVFDNAAPRSATVGLRVVVADGGQYREVPGSYLVGSASADAGLTLAGTVTVQVEPGSRIKLQWSSDDSGVSLACPQSPAAPTEATCAVLAIRHLGVSLA